MFLKLPSHLPKKIALFASVPLKIMKNVFYFILKALFVLKIFKFLSWLFGRIEKTWLENQVFWLKYNYNTHIAQYLSK